MGSCTSVEVAPESLEKREARELAKKELELRWDLDFVKSKNDKFIRSFHELFDREIETCIALGGSPQTCKFYIFDWHVRRGEGWLPEGYHMTLRWTRFMRAVDSPLAAYRERLFERLAMIVPAVYSVDGDCVVIRCT